MEFPSLKEIELNRFINYFYHLSNYEEEGVKIRPNLYITSNINGIVKIIPNCYKISMYKDVDGSNFKQRIKALMCFCRNNWQIYISYSSDSEVEYGLVKVLNSIKDKSLNTLIFNDKREALEAKLNLISIDVVSGGLIILRGVKGNKTSICFNLSGSVEYEWEANIIKFVNACVQKIPTRSMKKQQDIKNIYYNIFYSMFKGLHGTICLVVDKEFADKKGFLKDGTWLKEPIELGKLFLQSKNFKEFKLSSYVDLIVTMLNYDGITVVDNAGRILAYNVFIESNVKDTEKIVGGARRRAAYSLLKYKNNKVVGVYFQSQDGDNFYKDSEYYKKRRIGASDTQHEAKVHSAID